MYQDDLAAALARLDSIEPRKPVEMDAQAIVDKLARIVASAVLAQPLEWPLVLCSTSSPDFRDEKAWFNRSVNIALQLGGFFRKLVYVYTVSQVRRDDHAPILADLNVTIVRNKQLYAVVSNIPALQAAALLPKEAQ